jgi:hypothetical protein
MDSKKIVIAATLIVFALPAWARPSYKSILKKWTRSDKVYVVDNFEARMIWNATYLSSDFRAARREKLTNLLEWNDEDLLDQVREDGEESAAFDVFFISIYAGSSKWPDIGRDDGKWRILLEPSHGPAVEAKEMERIPVTQVERELYPYVDKWSNAYYVRFPKTLQVGESFKIRMSGVPAKSELAWTAP